MLQCTPTHTKLKGEKKDKNVLCFELHYVQTFQVRGNYLKQQFNPIPNTYEDEGKKKNLPAHKTTFLHSPCTFTDLTN
jgi:hypothetical protein